MAIVSSQNYVTSIYNAINASVGASCDVYELQGPQDNSLPVCTFQIITDIVNSKLNCDDSEITLQVDFYGWQKLGSAALRNIADTLFNDLHDSSLTISTVTATVNGTETGVISTEEDIFRIRQEYMIKVV